MKNSLLRMVFPVAVLLLTAGCGRPHFISDESFRREVDSVLNARAETFGPAWESLYVPEGKLTAEEKESARLPLRLYADGRHNGLSPFFMNKSSLAIDLQS